MQLREMGIKNEASTTLVFSTGFSVSSVLSLSVPQVEDGSPRKEANRRFAQV